MPIFMLCKIPDRVDLWLKLSKEWEKAHLVLLGE